MPIELIPITRTVDDPSIVTKGSFLAGTEAFFFFTFADIDGILFNPSDITITILDSDSATVETATTVDHLEKGQFVYMWNIPSIQDSGIYTIRVDYVVAQLAGSTTESLTESFVVTEADTDIIVPQVLAFRAFVESLMGYTQRIPVFHEIARLNRDRDTAMFTFPRWNQPAGAKIFVNGEEKTEGFVMDFLKGQIAFSHFLSEFDEVTASYTFRWFTDNEVDNFVAQSMQIFNQYAPHSAFTFTTLPPRYGVTVSHQAAVMLLRRLIMDLQFQEPTKVFGGMDRADKVIGSLDTLKKNFEEQLKDWYDEKKKQPYEGLTKTVTVPEFTLPGGRSRWFRYLFKGA